MLWYVFMESIRPQEYVDKNPYVTTIIMTIEQGQTMRHVFQGEVAGLEAVDAFEASNDAVVGSVTIIDNTIMSTDSAARDMYIRRSLDAQN